MTVRLVDLEGTVSPVWFVKRVLVPWARQRLPAYLASHADDRRVRRCLDAVRREVPDVDPVDTLLTWSDEDRKAGPLKELQGLVWREGWESGAFVTPLYADVVPAFARWRADGDRIAVYSSGSAEAQRMFLAHTDNGDVSGYVTAWFDTTVGAKREPASYARIAAALAAEPADVRFYSDDPLEVDAARAAGVPAVEVGAYGLVAT